MLLICVELGFGQTKFTLIEMRYSSLGVYITIKILFEYDSIQNKMSCHVEF